MKDLLSASSGCLRLENSTCCLASLRISLRKSKLDVLVSRRTFFLVEMVGTAKKSSIKKPSKKKSSTQELLAWPVVSPKSSLRRDLLHSTQLFTVPNFLTLKECEAFIRCAEARGLEHQGSGGPAKGEAFRDNERLADHSVELADMLWQAGLRELFQDVALGNKVAVGLNPNIRLYRYGQGQRFGPHYDESVDMDGGSATEFTLLVYLTGELSGGETVFYDRRKVVAEVAPLAGMALFHVHGARCLLHEAKPVTKGVNNGSSCNFCNFSCIYPYNIKKPNVEVASGELYILLHVSRQGLNFFPQETSDKDTKGITPLHFTSGYGEIHDYPGMLKDAAMLKRLDAKIKGKGSSCVCGLVVAVHKPKILESPHEAEATALSLMLRSIQKISTKLCSHNTGYQISAAPSKQGAVNVSFALLSGHGQCRILQVGRCLQRGDGQCHDTKQERILNGPRGSRNPGRFGTGFCRDPGVATVILSAGTQD